MSKVQHVMGKDLMVFVDGTAIALATSCKFTIKADMTDAASKDSGLWDEKILSKLSYEASSDSLFASGGTASNAHTTLVKKQISGEPVEIVFGIVSNPNTSGVPEGGWLPPTSGYFQGKVKILSVDFTGANGDKATMSVSFGSHGPLDVVDAPSTQSTQSASVEPKTAPVAKS